MEGGSCYSFPSSQSVYQDRLFLWQLFYPTFQSHQFLLPAPHIHQICVFLLLLVQTRSPHFISLPPVGCVISLSVHLIFSFHLTSSSQFKLNQFNQLPSPVTPLQELVFSSEKDCRKTKENFLRVIPLGEFFYMTESNEFHYFSCIKLSIFFKEHHINKKVVERLGFFAEKRGELHFWCWLPVPGKCVRSMFFSEGLVALLLLCWVTLLGCSPDSTMFPRDATS